MVLKLLLQGQPGLRKRRFFLWVVFEYHYRPTHLTPEK